MHNFQSAISMNHNMHNSESEISMNPNMYNPTIIDYNTKNRLS